MAYGTSNSSAADIHFNFGNYANDIAYYIDGMSVSAGEFNMFFNMEMASGGGVEIEGGGTFGGGESILDKYIAIFGDYQKAVEFYQRQLASLSNTSFWQEITYKSKVTQAELEEERKIVNCSQYDFEYQINDWAIKITSPNTNMYYIHDYQSGGGNNTSNGGVMDISDPKRFPDVTIFINQNISQGYFNPFNNTIVIPSTQNISKINIAAKWIHDYEMHEYGHYLQMKMYGFNYHITNIVIPSLITAKMDAHMSFWFERQASVLGMLWTGDKYFFPELYPTFK
jgi:hypothetical protein